MWEGSLYTKRLRVKPGINSYQSSLDVDHGILQTEEKKHEKKQRECEHDGMWFSYALRKFSPVSIVRSFICFRLHVGCFYMYSFTAGASVLDVKDRGSTVKCSLWVPFD